MKKNWNKGIALLLTAVMLLSALPAAGLAEDSSVASEWHGASGAQLLYTVTFLVEGAPYGSPMKGATLTLPDDPYLAGHEFVGWQDENGNTLKNGMALNGSMTAYAVFREVQTVRVEISYVQADGAAVSTAHQASLALRDYASSDYVVESPAKAQVNGIDYLPDLARVRVTHADMAAAYEQGGVIARRVVYAPADIAYTLVSKIGDVTVATEEKVGRMGSQAGAPEETAFGFLASVENGALTENGQTVIAHYNSRRFTLALDTAGGEAMASVTGEYGALVELASLAPAPRKGYAFDGWYDEAGQKVTSVSLTADRALTAHWSPAETTYTVVYYKQAFSGNDLVYEFDRSESRTAVTGTKVALSDVALTEIDNASFYSLKADASQAITVAADGTSVLNVYYDLNEYTLTFDANGGAFADGASIKTISVRLNQPIAALWPVAAKEGSLFYAWGGAKTYVTKQVSATAEILSKTTLTAQWTTNTRSVQVNYYLQDAQGNYVLSEELSQTIPAANNLSAKTIAGYNYVKAENTSDAYNFYYNRASYKFIYHVDGAATNSANILFEAPTAGYNAAPSAADGRVFAGWYVDAGLTSPYAFTTMPSHNVDLYAGWQNPTVTFVTDEGSTQKTVAYGQAVPAPAAPTKQYHTFEGWYNGDAKYDFSSPVKTDLTLTARFTLNELAYTVRYLDQAGGALLTAKRVADATLQVGAQVTETAPAIAGYLPDRTSASVTLEMDASRNVIAFTYAAAPSAVQYTVKYVKEDGSAAHADVVKTVPGSTAVVQENALEIEGLYPQRGSQSLTLTSGANEITFIYTAYQTSRITVRYLDMDGAALPGQTEETHLLRLAESLTVDQKAISGYTYDHAQGSLDYAIDGGNIGGEFTTSLSYRRNLTVRPRDLKKTYDGTALAPNGLTDLTVTGLKAGHSVSAVAYEGSQTEVGAGKAQVASLTITGPASGNDYYAVTSLAGSLTVTAQETKAETPVTTKAVTTTRKALKAAAPVAPLTAASGPVAIEGTKLKVTLADGQTLDGTTIKDSEGNVLAELTEDGKFVIHSGEITLSSEETVTTPVVVAGNANVILAGVNIETEAAAAIKIDTTADATITLAAGTTNKVKGGQLVLPDDKMGYGYAGIEVAWKPEGYAKLTIEGEGTLEATGGRNSAGIGGSKLDGNGVYGDITINSGTIVATGSGRGAGIGSSDNPNDGASHGSFKHTDQGWGTITINGGDITATGAGNGAGIGGGNHTDSGVIIINDGTINARGESGIGSGLGSSSGASKGPGYYCAYVTINGGDITAYGTNNMGSGIGGGMYSDAYVTITGGTINASVNKSGNVYQGGAGIGGGYQGVGVVTITGGTIIAEGANGAPGIGNGALAAETTTSSYNSSTGVASGTKNVRVGVPAIAGEDSKVEISGGTVTATGGEGAAGIGTGNCSEWCNVIITGGDVTAVGGASSTNVANGIYEGGAGIGSGASSVSSKLAYQKETTVNVSITGGNVVAIGAWGAAGIGSGAKNEMAAEIKISDSANVEAYSDGTKFAIDTRINHDDGTTTSNANGDTRTVDGTVLQGTFMYPWDATSGTQDARGLDPIVVTNEETGETITLTGMSDYGLSGYRSFATTVDGAGRYTIYTTDADIAKGNGAYFSVSNKEGTEPDNKNDDEIMLEVNQNELSDNFFLYPVKTIRVVKRVQTEGDLEKSAINMTAYFRLKKKGADEYVGGTKSIEIVNGQPSGAVTFVNVPEGEYSIIETDKNGNRMALNTMFGTAELKSIDTQDHHSASGTDNTGVISETAWTDDVTVINAFGVHVANIDVSGVKTWSDGNNQDGIRPASITVNLLADGVQVASQTVQGNGNTWNYTFTDVPKENNGKEIVYTVSENAVAGYAAAYDGMNITNNHAPERIDISGQKTWADNDDQDGLRPASITVNLLANGARVQSQTVTAANNWAYTFAGVARYANGQEITYTVAENPVEGYTATVNGYDITNAHTPETTSLTGSKTWIDQNDQDGIRPGSITVNLLSDGVRIASQMVSGSGDRWTFSFNDLPVYVNGRKVIYTVSENDVPGYTAAYDGMNITNTHTPHTVDVSGAKTWVDYDNQDGIRPASVTVRLLADGTPIDSRTVTGSGDQWSFSFTNLPQFANGREIVYTVTEDAVSGYTTTVTGTSIYNVHKPEENVEPERYTLIVRYWADGQQAFPTFTATYDYGDEYNVVSPILPGYTVDLPVVAGIIYQDTEVDVYYTPAEVHLTVYYQYLDGTAAADTHYETLHAGDAYDVISPIIQGYVANILRVQGVMPGRDVEYVVIYVSQGDDTAQRRRGNGENAFLEDYETPLGLGEVNLNAGECFE